MKTLICCILTSLLFVSGISGKVAGLEQDNVKKQVIFSMQDPTWDDFGAGALRYPTGPPFSLGLFDLLRYQVSFDDHSVYFDLTFRDVTNPFNAPEGYYHQRMEVFISTRPNQGNEQIVIGDWQFTVPQTSGWDIQLSVSPFGGTRVYSWNDGLVQELDLEPRSYLLINDSTPPGTIRIEVARTAALLNPDSTWQYYVLIGGFDSLAKGEWRTSVPELNEWHFTGEEVAIVDILAPPFGWHTQKRQLKSGMLHPVKTGWMTMSPWLWIIIGIVGLIGLPSIVYLLGRWLRARHV